MYKKYLSAINELINVALKLNGSDEVRRNALSDERLTKDRFIPRSSTKFRKGDIYQFEFGRNYFPEMSFEHRGLIIGVRDKLLYVLPICSFNGTEKSHRDAYHPIDNPDKKQDFFLQALYLPCSSGIFSCISPIIRCCMPFIYHSPVWFYHIIAAVLSNGYPSSKPVTTNSSRVFGFA